MTIPSIDPNDINDVTIKALIERVPEGIQTIFCLEKAMKVPILNGKDGEIQEMPGLVVSRRELQPEAPEERALSRTPPAAHAFYAVDGFVTYLRKFGSAQTVILVNPKDQMVQAILAESVHPQETEQDFTGNSGGRAVISLIPQVHPRWAPWAGLLGVKMQIETFVQFLRENRRSIKIPDGRELVLALAQIQCSTEINLHRGSGKDAINGLIVKTRIRGKEDSDYVELPESITVRAPLWVDQDPVDIEMDLILSGSVDGTDVMAQISSADIREAEVRAFDELTKSLRDAFAGDDQFTVAHGSVRNGSWSEVRG